MQAALSLLKSGYTHMTADSRQVKTGSVFVAYKGEAADGRHYIEQAIKNGAGAVVWEQDGFNWGSNWQIPSQAVEHLKQTSGMTLRYHPRYESTIRRVSSHLPVGLMASVDKTLGAVDFAITTNVGAATFSWRELLDVLKQKADQEQGI